MRRLVVLASMLVVVAVASVAMAQTGNTKEERTIVGYISDSMCRSAHAAMNMGDDKECAIKCVEAGEKFILDDRSHNVAYTLDQGAQAKAHAFAGQKVQVTGHVDTRAKTISVIKIEAAQ